MCHFPVHSILDSWEMQTYTSAVNSVWSKENTLNVSIRNVPFGYDSSMFSYPTLAVFGHLFYFTGILEGENACVSLICCPKS